MLRSSSIIAGVFFIFLVFIFSCGKKKAKTSNDIVVAELKNACDCMDAMGIVANEMQDILKPFATGTEAKANAEISAKMDKLDNKMTEINNRCGGELAIPNGEAKKCPGFNAVENTMREVMYKLEE
jgi:hypothetical protein